MSYTRRPPPEPRPSATLIMFRQAGPGCRIYLLRRSENSSFMAGSWVFPGGMLDDSDFDMDFWLRRVDLSPQTLDKQFGWGGSTKTTLAHLVAAVRETFEEAGVLLAGGGAPSPSSGAVAEFQAACREESDPFRNLVETRSLTLALSRLRPWSHWITPERMNRRYDTRFFIAPLAPGKVCRPDPRETPEGLWINPREALEENMAGRLPLSPPAVVTLHQMLAFETVSELETALVRRSWGQTIMPRKEPAEKGALLIEPWDPEYNAANPTRVPGEPLPVGRPFSRLWLRDGFWLPVDLPPGVATDSTSR